MKPFLKIILSIIIIFCVIIGGGLFFLNRGLETGSQLEINTVDLSSIDDGTYNGEYKAGRFSNEVAVTVENNKIKKIDAVKDIMFSKPGMKEELFNKVIEKQNTDIDVVSSATVSTKAYLKSIENALENGEN